MKTFDIKRFGYVFNRTMIVNTRNWIKMTIGLTIGLLLIFMTTLYDYGRFGIDDILLRFENTISLVIMIYSFLLLVMGSNICQDMNNRQQRIDTLMLPASNLEKYLVRYLYITVGAVLSYIVAFVLADIIQMIISLIVNHDFVSLTIHFINYIFNGMANLMYYYEDIFYDGTFMIIISIWIHSIYLLGGTFFRKQAWLFTSLALLLSFIIFMWILTGVWRISDENILYSIINIIDGSVVMVWAFLMTFFSAMIALNYCLSYKLFKRLQVINNKWINI